jgi:hypothetical protein
MAPHLNLFKWTFTGLGFGSMQTVWHSQSEVLHDMTAIGAFHGHILAFVKLVIFIMQVLIIMQTLQGMFSLHFTGSLTDLSNSELSDKPFPSY